MDLLNLIPTVPNFPKPGVMFKDISPLLANHEAFSIAISQLYELSMFCQYDYLLAIESRGFIFGAALAQLAKTGLILARKPNKLPTEVISQQYGLEYGVDTLQIQKNIFPAHARVLIIDDVLATGGTLVAASRLVRKAGGEVAGALVVLELSELKGKDKLVEMGVDCKALFKI